MEHVQLINLVIW